MVLNVNTRWQAFSVHLFLSLVVLLLVASIVLFHWYPGEFRKLGGILGLKIIAGVDVVLGPLLTLIVFNKAKKNLKWDLTAIACVQASALIYGLWSIEPGRPIAQVLSHNGVYIVTQADLDYYNIDSATFFAFSNKIPMRVYLDLPTNYSEINQITFATEFTTSKPLELRVDLYKHFDGKKNALLDFYLNTREKIEGSDCFRLSVTSIQEKLDGCLKANDGFLTILK